MFSAHSARCSSDTSSSTATPLAPLAEARAPDAADLAADMALAAVDVAMAVAAVAPERALATAAVDFCIIVLEEEAAVAAAASSRSPSGDVAASTGAIGCAAVSGGSSKTTAGGVAGCASAGVDDGKSSCPFEWVPVGTASGVRAVLTLSFRDACTGHQTGSRRQQKGAQCRNAPAAVLAAHPIKLLSNSSLFLRASLEREMEKVAPACGGRDVLAIALVLLGTAGSSSKLLESQSLCQSVAPLSARWPDTCEQRTDAGDAAGAMSWGRGWHRAARFCDSAPRLQLRGGGRRYV